MLKWFLMFMFLIFILESAFPMCYCACDDGQNFTEPAPPWELRSPADEDANFNYRQFITVKPSKVEDLTTITICDYDSDGELVCKDL